MAVNSKVLRMIATLLCGVCILYFLPLTITQVTAKGPDWLITLGMGLLAGGIFLLLYQLVKRIPLPGKKWQRRLLLAVGFVCLYMVQASFVQLFIGENGWDVMSCAWVGESIYYDAAEYAYLTQYPNNLLLILINALCSDAPYYFGLNGVQHFLAFVNIFVVDLAFVFASLIAKRLLKPGGVRVFAMIALPLFLFSPWLTVPYSDTLSMLFPMLTLWLYLKWREKETIKGKLLCALFMGFAGGVGFMLKPTALIMLVAAFLIMLVSTSKDWRNMLVYVLCIALAAGMMLGVSKATYAVFYEVADEDEISPEMFEKRAIPWTHFLMMGLTVDGNRYGAYYAEDAAATHAIDGKANKMEYNLKVVGERLEEKGFLGYLEFLCRKSSYVFNDGALAFVGEGTFLYNEPFDYSDLGVALQNFFYGDRSRPSREYVLLADGMWLMVLALMCVSFFQRGVEKMDAFAVMRLCLMGLALFLLLFEARARYLVNHLPLFALMAAQGFMKIKERK